MPASRLHFLWYAVLLWWCSNTPTLSHSLTISHSPSISVQEEQNRGKPNWEHLNEDLHVLITVEDSQARAEIKMRRAVEEVKKLLIPAVSTWHSRILVQTTGQLGYIWQTTSIPLLASCLLPHIERENRLAVHPVEWKKNIASCTHLLWPPHLISSVLLPQLPHTEPLVISDGIFLACDAKCPCKLRWPGGRVRWRPRSAIRWQCTQLGGLLKWSQSANAKLHKRCIITLEHCWAALPNVLCSVLQNYVCELCLHEKWLSLNKV